MKPIFNIVIDYKSGTSSTIPHQKILHAKVSFSFIEAYSYEELKDIIQNEPLASYVKFEAHEQYNSGERLNREDPKTLNGYMFGEIYATGENTLKMLEEIICQAFSLRRENLYTVNNNSKEYTSFILYYSKQLKSWFIDKESTSSITSKLLDFGSICEEEALAKAKEEFKPGGKLIQDGTCMLYLRRDSLIMQR